MESFENDNEVEITLVNSQRENTIIKSFKSGEYIISACCLHEGNLGCFYLQFIFEDVFIDNYVDKDNFMQKLKNVYIERLDNVNNRVECKNN